MPNHNSHVVYIPREFESQQGHFIESLMPGIRTAPNLTTPDNQKLRRFKNKSRYSRNNRYTRITGLPRSVYNKLYRQRSTRKKSRPKKSKQPKKLKKGGTRKKLKKSGTRKKKKKIPRKKSVPKKSRRNARGKRKGSPDETDEKTDETDEETDEETYEETDEEDRGEINSKKTKRMNMAQIKEHRDGFNDAHGYILDSEGNLLNTPMGSPMNKHGEWSRKIEPRLMSPDKRKAMQKEFNELIRN